jgi:nucleoside-diphosphate-sugar epimerase
MNDPSGPDAPHGGTDTGPPGHLLVLGYGYSAERLGRVLLAEGWRVSGTTRSEAGARRLEAMGVDPVVFDGSAPSAGVREALVEGGVTHLLDSIPPSDAPGAEGDPDRAGSAGLRHHAAAIAEGAREGDLGWLGLFSTTGVYGDTGGEWVDEWTPVRPRTDRARRRVSAERAWQRCADRTGLPLQIFRLPGIYGPGRSPLDRVRSGRARRILKEGSITNRIHVDDIAGAVRLGMSRPEVTGPIHVSDDLPAPGHEVLAGAADLLGLPHPPAVDYATAELSPGMRSFYEEDRRVGNRRLRDELGYTLQYPDWKAGLRAILALETAVETP